LLSILKAYFKIWRGQAKVPKEEANRYREELTKAHKRVWKYLEVRGGFKYGKSHCIITALKYVMETIRGKKGHYPQYLLLHILDGVTLDTSSSLAAEVRTRPRLPEFLILCLPSYPTHPESIVAAFEESFELLAFVSFEELTKTEVGREINHFMCVTFAMDKPHHGNKGKKKKLYRRGFAIFDDLLCLKPGNWQGACVTFEDKKDERIPYFEKVPLILLRRRHMPLTE